MTTQPATDAERLAALDFTPMCEEDCGKPATWLGIQPCCGAQGFLCDEHHAKWLEMIAHMPGGYVLQCEDCGKLAKPRPDPVQWKRI